MVDRLETAGRPVVYATTFEFLQYFGLANLAELPELEDTEPADEA
ncbi:MAG TPA: SMC-Scp complex subunit ScpB [Anaerolineae bacterium]|nr:SMC-Scp complex subunit ScpB [Anaerolineae bacterium]